MALSGLSFYQSLLRDAGISHVLSSGSQNRHAGTHPALPDPVEVHVSPSVAPPSRDQRPVADSNNNIPSIFLKYRRPAYCVWSYFNLPRDIQKGFTNSRCDLVNNIINNLQWNRQTYTFWPMSSLKEGVIIPDIDLFFKGINVIKPVYIFIFGSGAFQSLFTDRDYTYGQHTLNGYRVISLPDFDSLLPDNRFLKNLVWNILKMYAPPHS